MAHPQYPYQLVLVPSGNFINVQPFGLLQPIPQPYPILVPQPSIATFTYLGDYSQGNGLLNSGFDAPIPSTAKDHEEFQSVESTAHFPEKQQGSQFINVPTPVPIPLVSYEPSGYLGNSSQVNGFPIQSSSSCAGQCPQMINLVPDSSFNNLPPYIAYHGQLQGNNENPPNGVPGQRMRITVGSTDQVPLRLFSSCSVPGLVKTVPSPTLGLPDWAAHNPCWVLESIEEPGVSGPLIRYFNHDVLSSATGSATDAPKQVEESLLVDGGYYSEACSYAAGNENDDAYTLPMDQSIESTQVVPLDVGAYALQMYQSVDLSQDISLDDNTGTGTIQGGEAVGEW